MFINMNKDIMLTLLFLGLKEGLILLENRSKGGAYFNIVKFLQVRMYEKKVVKKL